MISAGRANRKVTINSVAVTNTKGDWSNSPSSEGQRYAKREALTHRETFASDQRFASADFVYKLRSDSVTRAIDATYQIADDGETYQVVAAIDPEGDDREVWVYVTRKEP